MAQTARAINILRLPAQRTSGRYSHSQKFGVRQRIKIAERMLGSKGILPDTRLGAILSHPMSRARDMEAILREILTFDRERHQATSDTITDVVEEIDSIFEEAAIISEAQIVINRLYHEKIARHGNTAMQADFPHVPTVEAFSRFTPNGHFDPYQYFSSESWGAIKMRLDYGKEVGYEKALYNFDLRQKLRDAFVVAAAFELIS